MQWDVQLPLLLALALTGAILWSARRRSAATAAGLPVPGASDEEAAPQPGSAAESTRSRRIPRGLAAARPWAATLFPVLLAVLVVRAFVIEPYRVPTGSMSPTLLPGDYVLVSKFAYGLRLPVLGWRVLPLGEPQRGDVLVFEPPHAGKYFIKRVVGLPGDRIRYVDGELSVNGQRAAVWLDGNDDADDGVQQLREVLGGTPYLTQRVIGMGSREGEWLVPPESYFTLGDNRDMSEDSRYWGYVAGDRVVGRAVAIWAHKAPGWALPTLARNGSIR